MHRASVRNGHPARTAPARQTSVITPKDRGHQVRGVPRSIGPLLAWSFPPARRSRPTSAPAGRHSAVSHPLSVSTPRRSVVTVVFSLRRRVRSEAE
jgi:hypothetical protein